MGTPAFLMPQKPLFNRILNLALLRMLSPRAFRVAAQLTALSPLTRKCLTPVRRSNCDIVASIPAQ